MALNAQEDDAPLDSQVGEILPSWNYATKKSVASNFLNVSLLMVNTAQLKYLFNQRESDRNGLWDIEVGLIIASLVLQVIASMLLFVLSVLKPSKEHHRKAIDVLNNTTVGLILFISILNMTISGFGLHVDNEDNGNTPTNGTSHH